MPDDVNEIGADERVVEIEIRNKTVDQLKSLKELGLREISLGVENDD